MDHDTDVVNPLFL